MKSPLATAALLWLGAGFLGYGSAGTTPAAASAPTGILVGKLAEGSAYDRLWSLPLLYKSEANPVLQELAFQGQLQTQYAYGSDDSGNFGSGDKPDANTWGDVDVRRFRFGVKARLYHSLKLHCLLDLYPDLSPRIYQRTAEAYLTYAPCDAFGFSVGKTELKFTREQEISSREILTFERSQLVNQFYGGELTGAWISGKKLAGGWFYELGAYGNDRTDEWTTLDGGTVILAKLGYNYTGSTSFENAMAEFHYLHNSDPGYTSPGDPPSAPYPDAVSVSNTVTEGRFGLETEAFWGDGELGKADVWGVTAIPSWFLTEKLQCVAMVEYACSSDPNGIFLRYRYEGQAPGGVKSGDSFFACYSGLNYYLYGHKLQLMSGVKYTFMDGDTQAEDFNGWTGLVGLRMAY